jgi:hypothetical protein
MQGQQTIVFFCLYMILLNVASLPVLEIVAKYIRTTII